MASLEVLKGTGRELTKVEVSIPEEFNAHTVESAWSLGDTATLHERRVPRRIDDLAVSKTMPARHALTLGLQSPDDDIKKSLLEDLEHGQMEGAATDFVPLLLLFTRARQNNYEFRDSGRRKIQGEPMLVLRYRQVAGEDAFTEFRDNSEQRHPAQGEIWFRETDCLPLRITLNSEEALSVKYVLRNEAEVNYTPTRFGLAPATVIHRQFLNRDMLVENVFRYSDYSGRTVSP